MLASRLFLTLLAVSLLAGTTARAGRLAPQRPVGPGPGGYKVPTNDPVHPCPNLNDGLVLLPSEFSRVTIGPGAKGIAVADVTQDGELDVAAGASHTDEGVMAFANGNTRRFLPIGEGVIDMAIGDFDQDGIKDIIGTNSDDDTVTILWGSSDPYFPEYDTPQTIAVGQTPIRVEAGDLNGDGYADFATLDMASDTVTVCIRNSPQPDFQGGFYKQTIPVVDGTDLKLADMDKDGDLDLVYARGTHFGKVQYRKNDGTGTFGNAHTISLGSGHAENVHAIALEDFNNDGRLDVVATRNTHSIVRVLAAGVDSYGAPVAAPSANNPFQIATADFDLDGNMDFVITHFDDNFVSLYRGNGNGNFQTPLTYDFPKRPYGIVAGDFNFDDLPDICVTAGDKLYYKVTHCEYFEEDSDLEVFVPVEETPDRRPTEDDEPQLAPSFRRGDVNRDGALEMADAIAMLNWQFLGGDPLGCKKAADANDDGTLDLADSMRILNFLFLGGESLPSPSPSCGFDLTADDLTCETYGACMPMRK